MFSFTYDTVTFEANVTYPKGTYDEWLGYAKTQFESVMKLMDNGKTEEAVQELLSIPAYSGYKPIADYLAINPQLEAIAAREAKYRSFTTLGGYVTFGQYEQDNNTANGPEPIEWRVVAYNVTFNQVLLLSRYGLDAVPYNDRWIDITWEKCTLRTWLNRDFLNAAFTPEERSAILTTTVDNSTSQRYSDWNTYGGNNTQDKVFLLSYAEANRYLGVTRENHENMWSRISPTAYAINNGAETESKNRTVEDVAAGWWCLRSPGYRQNTVALVFADGSLMYDVVSGLHCVVRPALWLDLDADIF